MDVVEVNGSYHITYIYSSIQVLQDEYDHQADALVTAATISDSKLDISADGRCDSPGHCALYGVVSFMEVKSSYILATEVIKVRWSYTFCARSKLYT